MTKKQWLNHSDVCFYCKKSFSEGSVNEATADHVIPKAYWRNKNSLTVLACRKCNQLKGHMLNDQFYKHILQLANQESVKIKNAKTIAEKQTAIKFNTYYTNLLTSITELELILSYVSKEINLHSINNIFYKYNLFFPEIKIQAIRDGIIQMKKN